MEAVVGAALLGGKKITREEKYSREKNCSGRWGGRGEERGGEGEEGVRGST